MRKRVEQLAIDAYLNHQKKFTGVFERWEELMNRYENKLREDSITAETDSRVTLGGAYSLVENAIPRILARQPKYRYLGREKDDQEEADIYDEFSEYQWEEARVQRKLRLLVKWALITGLAGWRMGWKIEKRVYKKRVKEIAGIEVKNPILELIAKNKYKDVEEVTQNYTFHPIKPFDLIWSVEAEDMEDVRILGYKTRQTIGELKKEGYNVKNLTTSIQSTDEWKEKLNQADGVSGYREQKMLEDEEVEIAVLYTRTLIDGIYKYHIVTLGCFGDSSPLVIRFEENKLDRKFIPMGIYRPVERPGKFYGFGAVEPSIGVLDAEEDTLNMALESLWTDISRPMEYNPFNVLTPDSIKYGSRQLVPVKVLGESVRVMETPVPNMNGVKFVEDYLIRAKQNISGVTDFQTGAETLRGQKTLGEIQIKTAESNARLNMMLDSLEKEVLEPMGKMALWLNQQYLANEKDIIYRIVGRKGRLIEKKIKFRDIEGIKDVIVVSGSTSLISQQTELHKWSLLLNQASQELQLGPMGVPINREEIWRRLLEDGLLRKDVEAFLPSLKEREEEEVKAKEAQIADAKRENANPSIARVMPEDDHTVHKPLHDAEIEFRQRQIDEMERLGQEIDPRLVEELQMLVQHNNDHVQAAGGVVPPFSAGMQVGQGLDEESIGNTGGGIPSGGPTPTNVRG